MNELDLIVACKSGDHKAQSILYKKYFGFLMGICLRYKSDKPSAEAALNFGFFKIITNLEKFNVGTSFMSWMSRIMVNTLIDEYRKEKKQKELFEYRENYIQISDLSKADYNKADEQYDADELLVLVNELPKVTKEVFNLFAIDGFKHQEIADLLNIKVGTSRWHLSIARKLLKEWILTAKDQKISIYGK